MNADHSTGVRPRTYNTQRWLVLVRTCTNSGCCCDHDLGCVPKTSIRVFNRMPEVTKTRGLARSSNPQGGFRLISGRGACMHRATQPCSVYWYIYNPICYLYVYHTQFRRSAEPRAPSKLRILAAATACCRYQKPLTRCDHQLAETLSSRRRWPKGAMTTLAASYCNESVAGSPVRTDARARSCMYTIR
jgi:hypothetical protein